MIQSRICIQSAKYFLSLFFLSAIFLVQDANSQSKFEFATNINPLVIPLNLGTYVESGPGYYDINGRGKITQAVYADITYWPLKSFGLSIGAGIRNFRTLIDYALPSQYLPDSGTIEWEGYYPFTAWGWGPTFALQYRKNRWRGSAGLVFYDLRNQKVNSTNRFFGSTTYDQMGVPITNMEVNEVAYWNYVPDAYTLIQLELQYNILENFFVKVGFETESSKIHGELYTFKAIGYNSSEPPVDHLLNDYTMKDKVASLSFGVGYILGFGKYKHEAKAAN